MELLAHIGAPTSKKDDDRYKEQFLSYLEFEPVRVKCCSEDARGDTSQAPLVPRTSPSAYAQAQRDPREPKTAWKSPFQRLEDVRIYRNLSSPVNGSAKRVRLTPEFSIGNESYHSISTIPSSQESSAVSRITATEPIKVVKTPSPAAPSSLLPNYYSVSESSSSCIQHSALDKGATAGRDPCPGTCPNGGENDLRNGVSSLEPRAKKQTLDMGSQVVIIDHGMLLNVQPTHVRPPVPESDSFERRHVSASPLRAPTNNRFRTETVSAKPLPNSPATVTEPTSSQLQELSSLPRQIRGPPPEVDSLDWNAHKSHVTKDLLNLEPIIEPAKRYKPLSQSRKLDAWERGYWYIDTNSWPVGTQLNFWNMLEKTIKRGSAGYATWSEMSGKRAPDGSLVGLGEVKLWCWGDEVMHMYLLLYTTSLRKIAKVGAQWKSWNGEVIVQMRDVRNNE